MSGRFDVPIIFPAILLVMAMGAPAVASAQSAPPTTPTPATTQPATTPASADLPLNADVPLPPLSPVLDDGGMAIDADAPLEPLPDLGVDWPDLSTPLPPMAELPPLPSPDGLDAPQLAQAAEPIAPPGSGAIIASGDSAEVADKALAALPALPPEAGAAASSTDGAGVLVAAGAPDAPAELASAEPHHYSVELAGFDDIANRRFKARFNTLSVLRLGDDAPANGAQLNRRIIDDTALLEQLVRNQGYYDPTLISDIRRSGDRLTVLFTLEPGPLYSYGTVNVTGLESAGAEESARLRQIFRVGTEDSIVADALVKSQLSLETTMLETGYPFADVGQELVTIDHDTRLGTLDQPVSPGARLAFGRIIADDGGLLGAAHIQSIARFRPGQWYQLSQTEDLRRALIATGLVASVDITPQAAPDGGSVDLGVALTPAPLRTIAGAIGYSSGEGYRAEISWEHRNLFPPEGALILRGVAGTDEQLAGVTFRRNNFRRRDIVMTLQTLASHTRRDAFDANTLLLSARIEQATTLIFQKRWSWSLGAELIGTDELAYVASRADYARQSYFIGSLAALLSYDRSDSLLDPTRGFRLTARVVPEFSFRGSPFAYVRTQLDGSVYRPVTERVVLAGRVRVGMMSGAQTAAIAPSRRYYSGGGGSVRGFSYQAIGPLDVNGKPVGGRSLIEFAAEARVRLGDFAIVPFVDAGNVTDASTPGLSDLRIGAGLGVRDHTNFGAIRVDVGTPVNRRPGDSLIGVYVSLGQAF